MDRTITTPEAVGASSERLARIKPQMQSFVDQYGYSGISSMLLPAEARLFIVSRLAIRSAKTKHRLQQIQFFAFIQ